MNPDSLPLVLKAARFAAHHHRNQRRKGAEGTPYVNHLIEVADLLASAGCDSGLVAAGFLHDSVEDAKVPEQVLRAEFGGDITDLVLAVTDDKRLDKATRKHLQVTHAATAPPRVANLKLADKISNLRSIEEAPPADWASEEIHCYIAWAHRVVVELKDAAPALLNEYQTTRARLLARYPGAESHDGMYERDGRPE